MLQKRVRTYNSYRNVDHVLWIPCGEVMYVSILISGLTTWYVLLFSFNTCSINRTWRSSANIGRLWFASPDCLSSYINATDIPTNLRSQEYDGILPLDIFGKVWSDGSLTHEKSIYQQSVELFFPTSLTTTADLTLLKGRRVGFAGAQTLSTTRNKSPQCMSTIHSVIYVRGRR